MSLQLNVSILTHPLVRLLTSWVPMIIEDELLVAFSVTLKDSGESQRHLEPRFLLRIFLAVVAEQNDSVEEEHLS